MLHPITNNKSSRTPTHARTQVPTPYPKVWTLDHLSTIISDLLRNHRFVELLRSFQIFDPKNLLFQFVLFYRSFVLRLKDFHTHLKKFVNEIQDERVSNQEWNDWTTRLAKVEVEVLLQTVEIQNRFLECEMLLSALSEASFASTYRRLYRSFSVLSRKGLSLRHFRKPQTILNNLLRDSHHEDARQYTKAMLKENESKLSKDDLNRITLEEVRSYVTAFRDTPVGTLTSKERQSLWKRCFDCFTRHNHPKIGSASFFLSTWCSSFNNIPSNTTTH